MAFLGTFLGNAELISPAFKQEILNAVILAYSDLRGVVTSPSPVGKGQTMVHYTLVDEWKQAKELATTENADFMDGAIEAYLSGRSAVMSLDIAEFHCPPEPGHATIPPSSIGPSHPATPPTSKRRLSGDDDRKLPECLPWKHAKETETESGAMLSGNVVDSCFAKHLAGSVPTGMQAGRRHMDEDDDDEAPNGPNAQPEDPAEVLTRPRRKEWKELDEILRNEPNFFSSVRWGERLRALRRFVFSANGGGRIFVTLAASIMAYTEWGDNPEEMASIMALLETALVGYNRYQKYRKRERDGTQRPMQQDLMEGGLVGSVRMLTKPVYERLFRILKAMRIVKENQFYPASKAGVWGKMGSMFGSDQKFFDANDPLKQKIARILSTTEDIIDMKENVDKKATLVYVTKLSDNMVNLVTSIAERIADAPEWYVGGVLLLLGGYFLLAERWPGHRYNRKKRYIEEDSNDVTDARRWTGELVDALKGIEREQPDVWPNKKKDVEKLIKNIEKALEDRTRPGKDEFELAKAFVTTMLALERQVKELHRRFNQGDLRTRVLNPKQVTNTQDRAREDARRIEYGADQILKQQPWFLSSKQKAVDEIKAKIKAALAARTQGDDTVTKVAAFQKVYDTLYKEVMQLYYRYNARDAEAWAGSPPDNQGFADGQAAIIIAAVKACVDFVGDSTSGVRAKQLAAQEFQRLIGRSQNVEDLQDRVNALVRRVDDVLEKTDAVDFGPMDLVALATGKTGKNGLLPKLCTMRAELMDAGAVQRGKRAFEKVYNAIDAILRKYEEPAPRRGGGGGGDDDGGDDGGDDRFNNRRGDPFDLRGEDGGEDGGDQRGLPGPNPDPNLGPPPPPPPTRGRPGATRDEAAILSKKREIEALLSKNDAWLANPSTKYHERVWQDRRVYRIQRNVQLHMKQIRVMMTLDPLPTLDDMRVLHQYCAWITNHRQYWMSEAGIRQKKDIIQDCAKNIQDVFDDYKDRFQNPTGEAFDDPDDLSVEEVLGLPSGRVPGQPPVPGAAPGPSGSRPARAALAQAGAALGRGTRAGYEESVVDAVVRRLAGTNLRERL